MKRLVGKNVADKIKEKLVIEIKNLNKKNKVPKLAIIRVGDRSDDVAYEKSAIKRMNTLGIDINRFVFQKDVPEKELIDCMQTINKDNSIHGTLLLRPFPKHINDNLIRNVLMPEKDVDGITDLSLGRLFANSEKTFAPCTAEACMEMLDYYNYSLQGKNVVVIGRSLVIGKPVSTLLLQKNSTVTICHSKTDNLMEISKKADILVVAVGKPKLVNRNYVNKDQVIIDVGIHVDNNGKIIGDVDYDDINTIVSAISPVPGGVGNITTMVLAKHVVQAASKM